MLPASEEPTLVKCPFKVDVISFCLLAACFQVQPLQPVTFSESKVCDKRDILHRVSALNIFL